MFTMKDLKVSSCGRPTDSPLDRARRAAGGVLWETISCLQGKPGQFRFPPCIPPPKLFLKAFLPGSAGRLTGFNKVPQASLLAFFQVFPFNSG